ncbi:acetyl-CoA C-acyltransferase [Desulfobacter hydrogenophilus]|uniref:Acetyl-CoA C-acetyltransferase n=1 Tax=Desulfobacter hydrogenophilus TaxID=2291 RepID=A0A328FJD6_9BACT|nr:acetyl-CoA C-acetyltransferase [Desulfobacter hydrogenophilus]NDY70996.1 acetyl-CoA C-acetyltransferase [Desulfobacter hydrogenophilus]QBH12765.1 acetyl-CoA C-acetyltransferase [Desulfobacter hydrogenophilus]RAM03097.1 acetyl-CoA C-acyltransferase [Desulfobacter hydrogenophilus]
MNKAVIVSATRTPLGSFGGSLSGIGATTLGGLVIREAIRRADIEDAVVDECIMGMVLPCGYGQNPGKQAVVKSGLPWEVEAITINKVCGSSLKAVMLAAQAIQCGDADVVVAGGMETMSMAPYYMDKARWGHRMGPGRIDDHMVHDGLWDVVNDFHMGMSNELCSERWDVTREDQDRFAAQSYERANKAVAQGRFKDEIMPVSIPQRKGDPKIFDTDECPKETSFEFLSKMKPAFKKDGVGTAGNASIISDGASAVIVMSESKAKALGCTIMAEIGAQASYGIDMKYVLMAPIYAIPKVLKKQGISVNDVGLFEINEAFAGTSTGINKVLELDPEKVNVNGGSVSLGHPIGASGTRVLTTLLYEMAKRDVKTGLASLCLGGGEAVALVVNR